MKALLIGLVLGALSASTVNARSQMQPVEFRYKAPYHTDDGGPFPADHICHLWPSIVGASKATGMEGIEAVTILKGPDSSFWFSRAWSLKLELQNVHEFRLGLQDGKGQLWDLTERYAKTHISLSGFDAPFYLSSNVSRTGAFANPSDYVFRATRSDYDRLVEIHMNDSRNMRKNSRAAIWMDIPFQAARGFNWASYQGRAFEMRFVATCTF
jgi:hypothetical protein